MRLEGVSKVYGNGRGAVTALDNISLTLPRSTFTAVMGPSGSGKSTFLHCAAGLDRPSSGSVWLGNTEISQLKPKARSIFRRDHIGFVFQAYNLLGALDVEQNVTLPPLLLAGRRADKQYLTFVLESVGLGSHRKRKPSELSGGQQQRVAIARALVTHPPTHSLPTNRPAPSTPAAPSRFWSCCAGQLPSSIRLSSWSRTTRWPRRTPIVCCSSPTGNLSGTSTARPRSRSPSA